MERVKIGATSLILAIIASLAAISAAQVEATTYYYNRSRAIDYARKYCYSRNPAYPDLGALDCTNFVSQTLYHAGHPMVGSGKGWQRWYLRYWYCHSKDEFSYTWTSAQRLRIFLVRSGRAYPYPIEFDKSRWYLVSWAIRNGYLNIGDIIQVDYDRDGMVDHSMIITNIDRTSWRAGVTYHWGFSGKDNIDVIDLTKQYPNAIFYAYHLRDYF